MICFPSASAYLFDFSFWFERTHSEGEIGFSHLHSNGHIRIILFGPVSSILSEESFQSLKKLLLENIITEQEYTLQKKTERRFKYCFAEA